MKKTGKEEIMGSVIDKMTLEEECRLLSGESFWYTQSLKRLGVESLMLTDGSSGLRKQEEKADHLGQNPSIPATCFPSEVVMASTWNTELVSRLAKGLGEEFRKNNVAAVLGPGMNIKRSPLCGRNFEYFSEDPFLSSHLGAAYIEGVQSVGVGACVKHFAANNQETHRLTTDVFCDERTLREIYLESFRYAIETAKPWLVMCAYNRLNGEFASESDFLIRKVLREDFGYKGAVVTDWGGINDRVKSLKAGLDLEMPDSGGVFDRKAMKAIENGTLEKKYVDNAVENLLGLVEKHREGSKIDYDFSFEKNDRLAAELGCEGVVLLKNDGGVLPLKTGEKIAVVGEFAKKPRYQGGGSSHTNPKSVKVPFDELLKRCPNLSYSEGFAVDDFEPDFQKINDALKTANDCGTVLVFAGLSEKFETEGIDRKTLDLPEAQNVLIEKLTEKNKNVVVVLSNGAPVLMPWKDKVSGIVEGYLLGQVCGEVLAMILTGEKNPSGKLAETFPKRLEDTPCFFDFPGCGGKVEYRENIFVGYRYYDTKKVEPLFPFGFGLSYTEFEYSDLSLDKSSMDDSETLKVLLNVTNKGKVAGAETVELYIHSDNTDVIRPEKELKGFKKLYLLAGETKRVEFTISKLDFACFDPLLSQWIVSEGKYDIIIGKSSDEAVLKDSVTVVPKDPPRKTFDRNTSFGEIYKYKRTNGYAKELIDYFERESGIDFNLGDNIEDFALTVVSDFPLKALVTFTKGRFSEDDLSDTLKKLNQM